MILEVAVLNVRPGMSSAFKLAFSEAASIIRAMPGYLSHQLQRCIEVPGRYLLLVQWTSLEAHTIGFRGSPDYQRWKALLHHFYDPFPTVEHYESLDPTTSADIVPHGREAGARGRAVNIELDHVIVSARDQRVSARQLAELLGVHWAEAGAGPFSAVYVNDRLTLDFIDDDGPFPVQHFCFRVDEEAFDAILQRIRSAGISYRSSVRGPEDVQINTHYGGRMIYWNEPDGHQWEMLTVSYARPAR